MNPVNFFALARLVAINWPEIDRHLSSSQLSVSRPVNRPNGGRGLSTITYDRRDLIPLQAKNRAAISEFYHSIYTHSIPWALHTKAFSKANRGRGLLGNDLDSVIRNSQYGQTVGIPIGPDTSLVIAECILTAVENLIYPKLPQLVGHRFVDDFELCFRDHASAEHALAVLQEQLLEFELRLNPRKTGLHVPPINFEPEWIAELRRFGIRNTSGQRGDLVAYFDLITKYLLSHPSEHVSKYGIKRSVKEVVESLLFLRNHGFVLDARLIWETLNTVITNSAPLGYQYEVSWALWGLIVFNIPLDPSATVALQSSGNSVIAILALDAQRRGLIQNLDTTRWAGRMTANDLREEEWLLSYEANVQNWLPSVGVPDHVGADVEFGFLKQHNIRFYVP